MPLVVVNMIPSDRSGEQNQDSEPNITVDPLDPRRIAGSAFTPNLAGNPNAPIYVSTDGGATWALASIVPSQDTLVGTGDITIRLAASGTLYAGTVAGGVLKPGDDVIVLPSGFTSKIRSIDTVDGL